MIDTVPCKLLTSDVTAFKRFWGYVKSLSGRPSIPDTMQYKDSTADTPQDIANLFSQFFAECFNPNDIDSFENESFVHSISGYLSRIECSAEEIYDLIGVLDPSSAAGVDGIAGKMLKGTAISVSPILAEIFNLSLSSGKVPHDWKISRIIPIFKSGDKKSVKNYRPISLQPIISKMLEKIIHKHILFHLQNNNLLTNSQFGFLPRSSTTDALLTAIHDWHTDFQAHRDVAVGLFDLAKAFDKVPHRLLIQKINALGISGKLLSWIQSYLSNRYQCVAVHGCSSELVPVQSGVPQGSVLGPLLFLTFINSLPNIPLSAGSKLVLYADDTTLYKPINNINDIHLFQDDINKIFSWFTDNFLQANAKKTKIMISSLKQNPYPSCQFFLDAQPIERVTNITFLGIQISNKLSWNIHIDTICKKARRIIGLIHRNFHLAPSLLRRSLYITMVRPILEYSCVSWHPLNKTLTNRLESVQRFACRVILQTWDLDHQELLSRTSLPTLESRRDFYTVIHVFKILNNLSSAPNVFTPHTRQDTRSNHSRSLHIPFSRLTLCQKSFYHHGPKLWNKLSEENINCTTLHSFKAAVVPTV